MLFTKFKKHVHYIIHSFQVSFVVPSDSIAGRMGLLITLVLVLINLFVSCTRESPNADSLTSVSAWRVSCIFLIWLYFVCESLPQFFFKRSTATERSTHNCIWLHWHNFLAHFHAFVLRNQCWILVKHWFLSNCNSKILRK